MIRNQNSQPIEPTILLIFGATGELAAKRLIPALYRLYLRKLLPKFFFVIGFSRSVFSHKQFRKLVKPAGVPAEDWNKFSEKIYYQPGNFANDHDFQNLASLLEGIENKKHSLPRRPAYGTGEQAGCANRLFYLATLPAHYQSIFDQLEKAKMLKGCSLHRRQTRIVVEKPFGSDLKSARRLDKTLKRYFTEEQIYRIDHYLGKETVQNLLTVRFANSIFEPIWNRNYIDHVQISILEEEGIGNRGGYYEQAGALRDFLQNHLMQLLANVAMEPPFDLSTQAIVDERAKVIKAIRIPTSRELTNSLVVGQYQGYRREPSVSPNSRVDTYLAVKLQIDNARWQDVPFYLRSGKKLAKKTAEISIHFKPTASHHLFGGKDIVPNVLIFKIQPNEGIFLNLAAKYPGFGIRLHPVTMELGYHTAFPGEIPEAYGRLLLDFMQGDQRLFARTDEIESAWRYVDAIADYLTRARQKPTIYPPGSWGPKTADAVIASDRRQWWLPRENNKVYKT